MESEFPGHSGIRAAAKFLRKNLPDYWSYFEALERIVRRQGIVRATRKRNKILNG